MYISTSVWVLRTPSAGRNSNFQRFLCKKLLYIAAVSCSPNAYSSRPAFWCKLKKTCFFAKICCKFLAFFRVFAAKTLKMTLVEIYNRPLISQTWHFLWQQSPNSGLKMVSNNSSALPLVQCIFWINWKTWLFFTIFPTAELKVHWQLHKGECTFSCIYRQSRQSSIKIPPMKNTSYFSPLFHATLNNPGYRKN